MMRPESTSLREKIPTIPWSEIGRFVALAFGISWIAGVALLLLGQAVLPASIAGGADILIKFGPSLAAVVVIATIADRRQSRQFWQAVTNLRVPLRWYAIAIFVPLAVVGILVAAYPFPSLDGASLWRDFVVFGIIGALLGGGLGEELGWRGYLFPALDQRHGFLQAVIITAGFWGLWHVPMFLLGAGPGVAIGSILVVVAAASLLLAWLYQRTNQSLPVCVVSHGAINGGATAMGEQAPPGQLPSLFWAYAIVLATISVVLVFGDRYLRQKKNL